MKKEKDLFKHRFILRIENVFKMCCEVLNISFSKDLHKYAKIIDDY